MTEGDGNIMLMATSGTTMRENLPENEDDSVKQSKETE